MRTSLTLLVMVAAASTGQAIDAADSNDVLLTQIQAPAPPQAPRPFRLEPQPRPRPQLSPAPQPGEPCRRLHMRLIPADPRVDPKFVKPVPDTGTKHTMREVTPPPQPQCR